MCQIGCYIEFRSLKGINGLLVTILALSDYPLHRFNINLTFFCIFVTKYEYRCKKCAQCPICTSELTIKSLDMSNPTPTATQPHTQDVSKEPVPNTGTQKRYFHNCSACQWSSLEVGLEAESVEALRSLLMEREKAMEGLSHGFNVLSAHYRQLADRSEKENIRFKSKARTNFKRQSDLTSLPPSIKQVLESFTSDIPPGRNVPEDVVAIMSEDSKKLLAKPICTMKHRQKDYELTPKEEEEFAAALQNAYLQRESLPMSQKSAPDVSNSHHEDIDMESTTSIDTPLDFVSELREAFAVEQAGRQVRDPEKKMVTFCAYGSDVILPARTPLCAKMNRRCRKCDMMLIRPERQPAQCTFQLALTGYAQVPLVRELHTQATTHKAGDTSHTETQPRTQGTGLQELANQTQQEMGGRARVLEICNPLLKNVEISISGTVVGSSDRTVSGLPSTPFTLTPRDDVAHLLSQKTGAASEPGHKTTLTVSTASPSDAILLSVLCSSDGQSIHLKVRIQ
ncbi:hypothetical protein SARC_06408 [Sphaeroforma arctica JP610]|uniref:Dynactin subunit 4 n=1 Tax=Sphaeroforma arctica JP610 TaxID=667725 RepID=A0A0L0FWR1_9EUKA|nr:hypothetical protein SARC_06408 [Sphaeroforma arctica JP610]KNC81262.1 hypothetical protein SARC_06408 [Sphaeroforma arctica JP610]|eukprot:XP_014155164.1 hypothetical protein SARC_06408 [Sphaeroforma arctica JP610]